MEIAAASYLKTLSVAMDSWTLCLASSTSLWKMDEGSRYRFACNTETVAQILDGNKMNLDGDRTATHRPAG